MTEIESITARSPRVEGWLTEWGEGGCTEILQGDGNELYLNCGGRYTSENICQHLEKRHVKTDAFSICKLYLLKGDFEQLTFT